MHGDFGHPLSLASAMVGFDRPWCIAGGWALDLWLGRVTRNHQDVEIALLRDHQIELRDYLADWTFKLVTRDHRLVAWKDRRQMLMLPVHEIHGTDRIGRKCEFLLNESDGIDWIYRREFSVRMNLSQWISRGVHNIAVLHPAIVLLYKSKQPREKDELDFRNALERMDEAQREWLKTALLRTDPFHPWIEQL